MKRKKKFSSRSMRASNHPAVEGVVVVVAIVVVAIVVVVVAVAVAGAVLMVLRRPTPALT